MVAFPIPQIQNDTFKELKSMIEKNKDMTTQQISIIKKKNKIIHDVNNY